MKTKLLAVCAAFLACVTISQAATIRGFVRPTLGYTKPADSRYDGAAVFGVAGGLSIGQAEEHEFSIEFLASGWTSNRYDSRGRWIGESTEVRVPVLANYRYYFRIPKSRVSPYLGAGIGLEVTGVNDDYGRGRHDGHCDYDNNTEAVTAFAAAGTAGLSINLSRFVDLDVGYRAMWQGGGSNTRHEYREYDRHWETESGWVHFVTVGASVRF